jgi:hypothetical protein
MTMLARKTDFVVMGELIAQLITDGSTDNDLGDFFLERFNSGIQGKT